MIGRPSLIISACMKETHCIKFTAFSKQNGSFYLQFQDLNIFKVVSMIGQQTKAVGCLSPVRKPLGESNSAKCIFSSNFVFKEFFKLCLYIISKRVLKCFVKFNTDMFLFKMFISVIL